MPRTHSVLCTVLTAVICAAPPAAGAQPRPTRDDARAPVPRELAAALVDAGRPLRTDSVAVAVGRLPEGFPAAPPLPTLGRVLGGVRWENGATLAVLAVDTAPAAAGARVLAAVEAAGWRPPPPLEQFRSAYPSFLSSTPPDAERDALRCAPPGGSAGRGQPSAVLVGARPREGAAGALVRVLTLLPAQAARCRSTPRPALANQYREPTPPLPGLRPPPNTHVSPAFDPGGHIVSYSAPARATGDSLAPAAFLAHYRRELAGAGWSPVAVPGWDTTRSTPLFVSPPDSAGRRWGGSVSAERDSTRHVKLTLVVAPVGGAGGGARSPASGMVMGGFSSYSTMQVDSPSEAPSAARPTRTALGPDTSAPVPRELVDALMSTSPFAGEDGRASIVVGRVPAGWTAPVPAASGRRVLGGWAGSQPVELDLLAVAVPGLPAQAQAAYLRQLAQAGWHAARGAENVATAFRGFLPSSAAATPAAASVGFTRCAPRRDLVVSGTAVARQAGGSVLRLLAYREAAAAVQCAPAGADGGPDLRGLERAQAPVPALTPPPGFTVAGGSAGGSFDAWRADAVVRGAASPAAVVEAYAAQLRAAGWSVGAVAGAPDVAVVRLTRRADAGADSAVAAVGVPASRLGAWTGVLSAAWREDGAYAVALAVDRRRR